MSEILYWLNKLVAIDFEWGRVDEGFWKRENLLKVSVYWPYMHTIEDGDWIKFVSWK